MSGFHGLPQKPQFNAQPQAGPSRTPNHHQRRTTYPYQQQPQPRTHVPQPAYPFTQPYAYPYGQTSGGYPPYQAYYQSQAAYQPQPYVHHPTSTPDGYTYSSTYLPQPVTADPRDHTRARTGPAQTSTVTDSATVKPWRNCSHPGCKYVGSGEDVEVHEGDRHLIFPNGKPVERSEEEEKWARHKGPPPPIEGTGIVLNSEEDIAKWIAERKAKWPSAKRVAEREEERQAAIARGENPDRGKGRGRGGGRGGRRADPASQAEDWGRPAREESQVQANRGGARGRGQAGGRGSGRGRGTAHHTAPMSTSTQPSTATSVAKPEHGLTAIAGPSTTAPKKPVGLVSYASEDDADSGSDATSDSDSSSDSSSEEEEVKQPPRPPPEPAKSSKPVCRFYAKNGRCKMGAKCRFSHTIEGKAEQSAPAIPKPPAQKQPPPKRINPFERPSMLGALLATPIQNTLSQLTQTIRFLVANDMLDGVELKPGDAEDQARERTRVQVVDQESADTSTPFT